MSFIARLALEGQEELNIRSCDYGLDQQVDINGMPSQKPLGGGVINVVIESDGQTDFFDWAVSPSNLKSGTITFYKRDAMAQQKVLTFTDAYCISYREFFEADNYKPMITRLRLSAREISLEDVTYTNHWPIEAQ